MPNGLLSISTEFIIFGQSDGQCAAAKKGDRLEAGQSQTQICGESQFNAQGRVQLIETVLGFRVYREKAYPTSSKSLEDQRRSPFVHHSDE
ncbi:hypothetical protein TNCV_4128811 [Trichonephila clavipes]|nr:hypothetical protein TNCV_4128811 [Trichonephila clavipes]